jgi:hypothetical protein
MPHKARLTHSERFALATAAMSGSLSGAAYALVTWLLAHLYV